MDTAGLNRLVVTQEGQIGRTVLSWIVDENCTDGKIGITSLNSILEQVPLISI